MNILKPIKKLFKKKTLKKIGIGLGIAAAALTIGGAIAGAGTPIGAAGGVAGVWSKVGALFGGGSAVAAPAAGVGTGAASGAATPGAASLGSSAAAPAISGATGGTGLAAGGALGGGASADPINFGQAMANIDFATPGASPVSMSNRFLQAAGTAGLSTGATVAAGAQPRPTTPTVQQQGQGVSPAATPPPQSTGLDFGRQMQEIDFSGGGASGDTGFNIPGSGLFQSATSAVGAAGDWFNRLPPITQFALLRGAEAGFSPDPAERQYELQDRLERRRISRNRSPRYVGGRFVG